MDKERYIGSDRYPIEHSVQFGETPPGLEAAELKPQIIRILFDDLEKSMPRR